MTIPRAQPDSRRQNVLKTKVRALKKAPGYAKKT